MKMPGLVAGRILTINGTQLDLYHPAAKLIKITFYLFLQKLSLRLL